MNALLRSAAAAVLAAPLLASCAHGPRAVAETSPRPAVKPGVTVLFSNPEYRRLIEGKRVGLITNPTGVAPDLTSTIDLIHNTPGVTLVRLFAPEHGVRGEAYAGEHVKDSVDTKTGVPITSLHGGESKRRPSEADLAGIDVLVYDIQDIGSRSYTYIYTMSYCMEEAGKRNIPFVVLDRPNPCGATVSGNILNPQEYSTFVGRFATPYQYGFTPGEIAGLFNERFNSTKCELHVVPMEGYRRSMLHEETGLPFVPTSTHIPSPRHAVYYNLTGIIGEIPHISVGVGYTLPFETIAAPWIDPDKFTEALRAKNLPGLMIRPISYMPRYSRFKDEMIHGAHFIITDYKTVQPVEAQIHIMEVIQKLYPEQGLFTDEKAKKCLFDEVLGTNSIRQRILAGDSADAIITDYMPATLQFVEETKSFRLYE